MSDIKGLLSLYEASHFLVHGEEDTLEEALIFSTKQLQSLLSNSNGFPIETQAHHALKHPIHKTLKRLGAKLFIHHYEDNEAHNKIILNFAKMDFNMLQRQHQKELCELTKLVGSLKFQFLHACMCLILIL